MLGKRRPWITCINMDCPKKEEAAKAKAEKEAKEAAEGGEQSSEESERELEKSTT